MIAVRKSIGSTTADTLHEKEGSPQGGGGTVKGVQG